MRTYNVKLKSSPTPVQVYAAKVSAEGGIYMQFFDEQGNVVGKFLYAAVEGYWLEREFKGHTAV